MRNRDYFSRPIQSNGRDAHDYGRTGPITRERDPWTWPTLIASALIAIYFAWEFCR